MKFNVTFRCALPFDLDQHPAGEDLAAFLGVAFREKGLNIHLGENWEDFAWSLEFKNRSPAPYLLVGLVGDDEYQWLVQINSGVGWLGRLFGRSDDELREEVAKKLHGIISLDSNFSAIRWHKGDFTKTGWAPHPSV